MDDLLISGLATTHRSYSRAVTAGDTGEDAPPPELDSLENQVIKFLAKHRIDLQASAISACHTLPRKDTDSKNKPLIVMRFVNRKTKVELLRQGRKLRGTNVYLNDHLTKRNADIAREARILKKQSKIQGTWTRNCKVWIKTNGSPEAAKAILVRDINDLDKYR
ncbi:unnamed protein product [Merluccius merluccius]